MPRFRTTLALAAALSPLLSVPAPSQAAADPLAEWAFDRAGEDAPALPGVDGRVYEVDWRDGKPQPGRRGASR